MQDDKTAKDFFKYYALGVLATSVQLVFKEKGVVVSLNFLSEMAISFVYINIIGIWVALAKGLQDWLYSFIKKLKK